MKKTILAIALLFSQVSFAKISNSSLELRHQDILTEAVTKSCGYMRDLTELSNEAEDIIVDNSIRDIKFVTTLSGVQRLDQNIFDKYIVTVKSEYTDMYDHSTGNWGAYIVSSVSCVME